MKAYENTQGIEISIIICLHTARRWLGKLGYKYKNMRKDVLIDRHKQSDIVKDCKNFFKNIKELKPCMVEFEEGGAMKAKTYPSDCKVRGPNWCSIIVIIHDEYTFSANDGIQKAWIWKGDTFLRSKG